MRGVGRRGGRHRGSLRPDWRLPADGARAPSARRGRESHRAGDLPGDSSHLDFTIGGADIGSVNRAVLDVARFLPVLAAARRYSATLLRDYVV